MPQVTYVVVGRQLAWLLYVDGVRLAASLYTEDMWRIVGCVGASWPRGGDLSLESLSKLYQVGLPVLAVNPACAYYLPVPHPELEDRRVVHLGQ
jgi:hypothetical protein